MSRIKLLQSGMQVCQRFHKAGVISGLPELFLQPSDFLSQGSIFRTQILALLTEGLFFGVGFIRLGLKGSQFGFHLGEEGLVFGKFLLLLAQTALHGVQIGLNIGDFRHHGRLVENAGRNGRTAQEQCRHHQDGEHAGKGILHGETASFIP